MKPFPSFFDAWTSVGRSFKMHPRLPFSVKDLVRQMQYCDVGQALVSQRHQGSLDPHHANLSLTHLLPDALSPIWTVLPGDAGDFPTGERLLRALEQHHVPAVQIFPKTHAWNPRGKAAAALFDALGEGGWPVFVPLDTEYPLLEFEELVARFPHLLWVALHADWKRQREVVPLILRNPHVYVTLECYQANRGIEYLIENGGGDQLLFASGAPGASMGAAKACIDWLMTDATARAAVAGENVRRILRFQPPGTLAPSGPPDQVVSDAAAGRPLHCEVIDFHSHILEDGHGSGGSLVMLKGDAAGLLELADRVGIDQIGVMTWRGIQGPEQDEGHLPVIAAVEKHPDRFWGLATIHVDRKSDARKIADLEAVHRGRRILGLKPYPTLGLRYDDPAFAPLWEYAEKHGLYVGAHPFLWYQPEEFISLCTRYPKLKVVAFHAGHSYEVADTVISLCRRFPNLYAEINYSSLTGGVIEYLVEGCGADRVLFGTDQPMRDPRQQLGWVVYADLPVEVKRAILGGNARRLLEQLEDKNSAVADSASSGSTAGAMAPPKQERLTESPS